MIAGHMMDSKFIFEKILDFFPQICLIYISWMEAEYMSSPILQSDSQPIPQIVEIFQPGLSGFLVWTTSKLLANISTSIPGTTI